MEPLKEMFNKNYYEELSEAFYSVNKQFDKINFIKDVTHNINALSLNERLRNTSVVLKKYLPEDFKKSVNILSDVIPNVSRGYTSLVFPDYISLYGLKDFDISMKALKLYTQYGSSEFAIRVFLKQDFTKTIKVMEQWANDNNHHVRRLASEGSRPRLPWSFKIDEVIKNPKATKKILETLKADNELYVKKSVANHLNDISKDNPGYVLSTVEKWEKSNTHTAWIVKHACRTLIKKGNKQSLNVFGFEKNVQVNVKNLKLNKNKIKLGEQLHFEFDIVSQKKRPQKLVIDYIVHYQKSGKTLSPKVFKLKEIELLPSETVHIKKSHWLKDFTTRKHFAGKHVLEIMINGNIVLSKNFELLV